MQKAIFKTTVVFSLFTILAQLLAILRDIVLVRFIGIGPLLDTYYLAFKIPDLLSGIYMIFLGSVVFIPIVTRGLRDGGPAEASKKISQIATFVFGFIIFMSSLFFIFMPYLVSYFMPHLPPSQQADMISLSRILLISQMIFPIGIVAGAVAMVMGKTLSVAISSSLYNVGILLGAMILYPVFGLDGLGFGVIFGAILFTAVQIYPQPVREIFSKLRFNFDSKFIFQFINKNYIRFASVFIWQFFLLLLIYIASKYGPSAVSTWSLAYGIEVSLISVIGVSIGSVLMPIFAKSHVEDNVEGLRRDITNATIYTTWFGLIVTTILFFTSLEFIKIIFYFAKLNASAAGDIALVFSILLLALPLQNYFEILRKYLYSREMIVAVSSLILIFIGSALALQYIFSILNIFENKVLSMAFAFTLANAVALFLFSIIFNISKYIDYGAIYMSLRKVLLATALTCFIYIYTDAFFIASFSNLLNLFILKSVFIFSIIFIILIILRDSIIMELLHHLKQRLVSIILSLK
jgi:putative peptidoglycan lipid II flippase